MSDKSKINRRDLFKKNTWLVSWVILVILSQDFVNWGRVPRLYLGLPGWLWWDVGLVLLTALVFGFLSRFAWGNE